MKNRRALDEAGLEQLFSEVNQPIADDGFSDAIIERLNSRRGFRVRILALPLMAGIFAAVFGILNLPAMAILQAFEGLSSSFGEHWLLSNSYVVFGLLSCALLAVLAPALED